MKKEPQLRIVPMRLSHIEACAEVVRVSEPWKRLNERVDFPAAVRPNRTGTRAYVCMEGKETAGFILFIPEPVFARGGYLRAIGVAPRFRGQGVGRLLLSFAERMTARGALNFFLCVSSFNRSAQAFYRSCGYRKVGTLPGFLKRGASEYIYWKRLTRTAKENR